MDRSTLLYGSLAVLAVTFVTCYVALLILSPAPRKSRPSEKTYRSAKSPKDSQPLNSITDSASVDLTVVVPAYNETERMPGMLQAAINHLSKPALRNRTYELVIVDDGSSDGTADLALKFALGCPKSDIRVVRLEENAGKGGAVRHGMLHGRGRRLLFVDADGASRFEDLELLWKEMDRIAPNEEAAVAVGSRAHLVKTEAVVKRSVLRNILMYGLHTILRIVGVGHIRDTQCGFKLFSRAAAQRIFPYQHLTTWIFDVELLLLAKQLRMSVVEVPIEWHEVSGSKLNVVTDSLQMLRDLLVLRANHLLGRWKVAPAALRTGTVEDNGQKQ
ncbi:glycosyltransferase family 2 protein [Postia placenta MAD-698-R-SB12]|uniref:dolichyl-phosphate beta-glucosyltransferase n=1 Tax=Postia placenta MAD-698-R-SB12 TaxID=670580 RepID=A0A1X6N7U5_9APHY|nr:glycosyltransferase family 2 protein [Postia placenta MAD-698-R-SB12]OSX64546.1 glycosyltransferase family 2 protein [Postia placenta MAD-698-R-SB12]